MDDVIPEFSTCSLARMKYIFQKKPSFAGILPRQIGFIARDMIDCSLFYLWFWHGLLSYDEI